MDIRIDRFRLKWPLRLSLEGVMVAPAPGDTMVMARNVALQVEPLPLLALDVRVQGRLDGVRYRMGTPDSVMYINADVDKFTLNPSSYTHRRSRRRRCGVAYERYRHYRCGKKRLRKNGLGHKRP